MSLYSNRLKPHREGKIKSKSFDPNNAFSQKKLTHHVLFSLICSFFGNKIIALIYLYHLYKVFLLLNGKAEDKAGKEHSYYIRICILRELSIITACFRLFIFVIFCIGFVNAFENLGLI